MDAYLLVKILHVLGAIVLLGTGSGIAFFMFMAHRTGDVAFVARTAAVVVVADLVFTALAAAAQPVTGLVLASMAGIPFDEPWLACALALYAVAGLAWLPVVFIQVRMRDLARAACLRGEPLPGSYHRLYRAWLRCGVPGFGSVLLIVALMVAKPALWR